MGGPALHRNSHGRQMLLFGKPGGVMAMKYVLLGVRKRKKGQAPFLVFNIKKGARPFFLPGDFAFGELKINVF